MQAQLIHCLLQSLLDEDAFGMLKGLLHDKVATVQQTAALAVGRMANFSIELSEELVRTGILEHLTSSVRGSTVGHMKAAAFVIKSVAKHTESLCQCCIETQSCQTMVWCLEQIDVTVREAAATALTTLASHAPHQAAAVVEAGALPLLVGCMQEPEPALKRAACATLAEISKHSAELAQAVIEAGALPVLTALLKHAEPKVRKQAANALGHIVKHSANHAEAAVEARLFPSCLVCMHDRDGGVRRQAAIVTREVAKHSQQLASVVAECGGIGSAVELITSSQAGGGGSASPVSAPTPKGGTARLTGPAASLQKGEIGTLTTTGGTAGQAPAPAVESIRLAPVMALGFISAFGESLAQGVIDAGGVHALKATLLEEPEDHVRAAAVWALGQVGKHSASHANALASADMLRHVLAAMHADESSDDLREKGARCLSAVLSLCTHVPAVEALLPACPSPLAKIALKQLHSVLSVNAEARKGFLASGGLKMIQAFDPAVAQMAAGAAQQGVAAAGAGMSQAFLHAVSTGAADADSGELLDAINMLYPADVVVYCRPDYYVQLSKTIGEQARVESRQQSKAKLQSQYAAMALAGDSKVEGDSGSTAVKDVAALPNY